MKLFLDQDVYKSTAHLLKRLGHDVLLAAQAGLSQARDEELLLTAQKNERILITRDRDYGNLVFVKGIETGVIYLRMLPANINEAHHQLEKLLEIYSEEELSKSFVVVEPNGYRIRKYGG